MNKLSKCCKAPIMKESMDQICEKCGQYCAVYRAPCQGHVVEDKAVSCGKECDYAQVDHSSEVSFCCKAKFEIDCTDHTRTCSCCGGDGTEKGQGDTHSINCQKWTEDDTIIRHPCLGIHSKDTWPEVFIGPEAKAYNAGYNAAIEEMKKNIG